MTEKFKSTIIFDIDFDKLREDYPWLFWLDEVLKLHAFLEVYEFQYIFSVGYQADCVRSEEEIQELIRHLAEELPWVSDCTTRFDYMELGEPQDITHLIKAASPVSDEELAALKVAAKAGANDDSQEIPPLIALGAQKNMTVNELMAALAEYAPDAVVGVRVEEAAHPFWELGAVSPVVEMETNQTRPVLHIEKIEVNQLP